MRTHFLANRFFAPILVGSLALVLVLPAIVPSGVAAAPSNLSQATAWLRARQLSDGGFPGSSGGSDPDTTSDVAVAFASAGIDPGLVEADGHTIVDYLQAQAPKYAGTVAGAAKLTLAAVASGTDPHRFGGLDLITAITQHYDQSTGLYDKQLFIHSYAIMALAAAHVSIPSAAVNALLKRQSSDGGWSFSGSTAAGQSDSNTTAIVIESLIAAGDRTAPAIDAALGYLHAAQTDTGAFVYQIGAENPPVGDANSTAVAVQALIAAGTDPSSADLSQGIAALQHFQNSDGAFRYRDDTPDDNILATVQAIPALAEKALPIAAQPGFGQATTVELAMQPTVSKSGCVFETQTQHNICAGFEAYWMQFGGLAIYGYPLTEEFTEKSPETGQIITVQYFERARFEWHPGAWPSHYDVELGLLGDEATAGRASQAAFQRTPQSGNPSCYYFPQTGHNLCGGFGAYWQHFGGLSTYGLPISEELQERNPATGQMETVQYFERARFEWHPGVSPSHYDVLLGRLGAEALESR